MPFTSADLVSFWSSSWGVPLRSACRWLSLEVKRRAEPGVPVAWRLGTQCLSRWVGQAIAARWAWLKAHPDAPHYCSPEDSAPVWAALVLPPYDRGWLRTFNEEWDFLWAVRFEAERLMRLLDYPPVLIGEEEWTTAVLALCARLNLVYGELKRRYRAKQARAFLQAVLAQFVVWDASGGVR